MTLTYAFSPSNMIDYISSPEIRAVFQRSFSRWASVIPVNFTETEDYRSANIKIVATHEIGHVLGLAHSSVQEAVMYLSLRPRSKRVDLKLDDVQGVQALYGSNPNFKYSSLLASEHSSNQAIGLHRTAAAWCTLFSKD
ncbi:hypothetical protein V6N11_079670 [Hibiscus sabdariffa]|uniref:Peptidase metallopeptidase domain-containing protein n=1 Tax=Hibiscus sabdariffa TaxID=183260 RepID=A0ABR2RW65_9ROSI